MALIPWRSDSALPPWAPSRDSARRSAPPWRRSRRIDAEAHLKVYSSSEVGFYQISSFMVDVLLKVHLHSDTDKRIFQIFPHAGFMLGKETVRHWGNNVFIYPDRSFRPLWNVFKQFFNHTVWQRCSWMELDGFHDRSTLWKLKWRKNEICPNWGGGGGLRGVALHFLWLTTVKKF